MSKTKITYVFIEGRKKNFLENTIGARDFYYGLTSFDVNLYNLEIIEFKQYSNKLFKKFDHYFSRLFSLPIYFFRIINFKNLRTFLKSNEIIFVSESTICSALPLILIIKLFRKVNISVFVMGLYSKNVKFKFLHNVYVKLLNLVIDNQFFLGKKELENAEKFKSSKSKSIYFPFAVDYNFWSKGENQNNTNSELILFVGNDGNRDIDLLIKIAESLPDFNFLFVSSLKSLINVNLPNVELVQGSWSSKKLSDEELRSVYKDSKLSIIPTKETSQPTGQSVAMQSMACGTPVIISKTDGFWDYEKFENNRNIFFVENNNSDSWVKLINELMHQDDALGLISKNASETIKEFYDIKDFQSKLNQYVN